MSSLLSGMFGGKKDPQPTQMQPPPVADKGQEDAKRKLGRASLYMTSPQGDLNQANTTSGRLLGN